MAWGETTNWLEGKANEHLYQRLLDDSRDAASRNGRRKKVVKPSDMPWEMSRQGLLKHLINEHMNTRMETVDAYMQIIPPGSRSGRHRHLAEECVYVLEGRGYDIHDGKKIPWKAGDIMLVENGCVHQHFNDDPDNEAILLVFKAKPLFLFMHLLYQKMISYPPNELPKGHEDWMPPTDL